jgi:hypothetical protein
MVINGRASGIAGAAAQYSGIAEVVQVTHNTVSMLDIVSKIVMWLQ